MFERCYCHMQMHGKTRTVITAIQPEKVQQEQDDDEAVGQAFPLMAERSFAREFFHLVLNAGWTEAVLPSLVLLLVFVATTPLCCIPC